MTNTVRPRRSVLYMPGANTRALEKARTLPADALIFDLEDAVAPEAKVEARARVCAAAASDAYGLREVTIRVNGLDTEWHADDVRAAAEAGPAAVVVPKVNSVAAKSLSMVFGTPTTGTPRLSNSEAIVSVPSPPTATSASMPSRERFARASSKIEPGFSGEPPS